MKHPINLGISDESYLRLQEFAGREKRSVSNLVAKWIEERLIIEEQQKEQEK